jgi:hypothetical protein
MEGRKGETRTGLWRGNLREVDHLEDPGMNKRIILKWIFVTWDRGYGLYLSDSG